MRSLRLMETRDGRDVSPLTADGTEDQQWKGRVLRIPAFCYGA